MRPNLSHVETWIFDLDNTLYHPSARLFDQINAGHGHIWLCHRVGT